ncbi:MAG TPA: cytochrome c biogenesis CcdA family protein [Candidatus Dormibacteraeota bacterium]|nr:cytochrome c biogenesis CcdA family protein [Candidatus Dormibacteraeota bacterium]
MGSNSVQLSTVTIPLAAAAGAASFLSPCVLPLVPAYLAFLGHEAARPGSSPRGTAAVVAADARWRVLLGSLGFVLGLGVFSTAFFYALDRLLSPWRSVVTPVLGVVVVLLGLTFMGVIRIGWLSHDLRRLPVNRRRGGFGAGFLLGIGLAAGWSPCIGPVLGAVLTTGVTDGATGQGLYLMAAYCLGLGLPFLLAAILLDRIRPLLTALGRHQRLISVVGGTVVVLMGVLVTFNHFTIFNDWLSAHMPSFFQDPFNL